VGSEAEFDRTWIVRGQTVGLTAFTRGEYIEQWDRINDPVLAMLSGLQTTTIPPRQQGLPPVMPEHRDAVVEFSMANRAAYIFAVRVLADGRLIGEAWWRGISWPNASAELSMQIYSESDRGKGYATEAVPLMCAYAFDVLGLRRLTLHALVINEAVMRIADRIGESVGARRVGIEREAWWAFGRPRDVLIMDLLRHEFPPHPATAIFRLDEASGAD
jgi:RimJ/RimL family protein N-acetyltransferase